MDSSSGCLQNVDDFLRFHFEMPSCCVAIGHIYIYSDIMAGDCALCAGQATISGPGLHSNLALSS